MRWEAREAKRELAEAALRLALAKIESARPTGGPANSSSGWYVRALQSVRHAETLLRQSEGA